MTEISYHDLSLYAANTLNLPDSVVEDLIKLFHQINKDLAADNQADMVFPLTDDSYVDQIHNEVENWITDGFSSLDMSIAARATYDRQTSASYQVAQILFKRMQELLDNHNKDQPVYDRIPKSMLNAFGDAIADRLADDLDQSLADQCAEAGYPVEVSVGLTIEVIISQPEED